MKLDGVMADLGMGEVEFTEDAAEMLAEHLEAFLRGGGVFSWSEWRSVSDETRDALRVAGDRMRREMLGMLAVAIHRPIIAESLLSGDDPEDTVVRRWLEKAADDLESKVRK